MAATQNVAFGARCSTSTLEISQVDAAGDTIDHCRRRRVKLIQRNVWMFRTAALCKRGAAIAGLESLQLAPSRRVLCRSARRLTEELRPPLAEAIKDHAALWSFPPRLGPCRYPIGGDFRSDR